MDTIVAGLSKSLTTMRSMRDGEMHAAEKADIGGAIATEKVVTSEEHAEANVNTDWSNLLDAAAPPTALRNFFSDAARALAPDEREDIVSRVKEVYQSARQLVEALTLASNSSL